MVGGANPQAISGGNDHRKRTSGPAGGFRLFHWLLLVIAVALALDTSIRTIALLAKVRPTRPPAASLSDAELQWLQSQRAKTEWRYQKAKQDLERQRTKRSENLRPPGASPTKGQIHLLDHPKGYESPESP